MITPGQVVVCISARSPCVCGFALQVPQCPDYIAPVVGRMYRVAGTDVGFCTSCREQLPCLVARDHLPVRPGSWAWPSECFRPVRPATLDIFRLARSPTRIGEPA